MNGATHMTVAGASVGLYLANEEAKTGGAPTVGPLMGGVAAALFTNLPDFLEPATSPNHRAFFHSLAFAGLLGAGLYRLSQWQPETATDEFWKSIGLLVGSAYLIHLALDFTTQKSLPLLGRI